VTLGISLLLSEPHSSTQPIVLPFLCQSYTSEQPQPPSQPPGDREFGPRVLHQAIYGCHSQSQVTCLDFSGLETTFPPK
jgi:hypothetical protein